MLGTTINDRFKLTEKLGEGGMAVVYRAEDLENGNDIALKMMKTSLSGTAKRRFAREFRAIATVDHPNCIKVYEFAETADFPFFTMELFSGNPITALIDRNLNVIMSALYQAAAAVEYVHGSQIIHRDLKPSNMLVYIQHANADGDEQVALKLADFGLARFHGAPSSLSVDSGFVGTLAYSAPEQIASGTIDHRCDLYSLGVICYELLTGRYPFQEAREVGMQALMRAHLTEVPISTRTFNSDIPQEIDEIVLSLLSKRASKRPTSASMLKQIVGTHLGVDESDDGGSMSTVMQASAWNADAFVAREKELSLASRMMSNSLSPLQLDETDSLQPSVVFVTGEAGIGKSHFLREIARLARRHGADVFEGRCFEGNLAPYQPFVEIVRQLLTQLGTLEEAQAEDHWASRIRNSNDVADAAETASLQQSHRIAGETAADVVRNYAAELLRIAPDLRTWLPGKAFRQVDLSREANYVLRAIATFFVDLATLHGTCLLIEDLHWADQSSLDLLRHIASILYRNREQSIEGNKSCPRLFICCTLRPEDVKASDLFRELERERFAKVMELESLSADETRQLVATVLGVPVDQPSDDLVEQVAHRCKGNPYFITESVRSWQSTGKVVRTNGQWALDTTVGSTTAWPDSVRGVLRSRLASISDTARQVLGPCTVIGSIIDVEVLRQVCGEIGENEFLDAIDELLSRQILVEAADARCLEFSHDLLRELTYEELTGNRRRALHRRVGEVLEELGTNNSPEQLAGHYYEARSAARAFPHLLKSAETALTSYAVDDALGHLERAKELEKEISDADLRLQLHGLLATSLTASGRPTEALASHRKQLEICDDGITTGDILRQIGELHFRIGDFASAVQTFDQALEQIGYRRPRSTMAVGSSTVVSLLRHTLPRWLRFPVPHSSRRDAKIAIAHGVFSTLELLFAQQSVMRCGQAHGRHLVLADQIGDPSYLTHASSRQALIFGIFSLNWLALRAGRKALGYAQQLDYAEAEAIAKGHVGCAHYFGARLNEAENLFREALAVLDRRGDSWERMYFYHNLRHLYSIVGDAEREIECARVEMQIAEAVSDPEGTCWGAYGIANALARSGRLEEAHGYMERALGILSGRTNIIVVPTALQTYGFVHLQSGNYAAAREVLEESCQGIRRDWAVVDYTVRAYPLLVEALLGPNWHDESNDVDDKTKRRSWKLSRVSKFWAWRFPNYMPHAMRVRGRAALAVGKRKKAIDCFTRAIKVGESIGAKFDTARAHLDFAKLKTEKWEDSRQEGQRILEEINAILPECDS